MRTLLLTLCAGLLLQGPTLKLNDLDSLTGKKWIGTLTYLDYTTNKLELIPTELTVTAKGNGVYSWFTVYPKESSHNSTDDIIISADGKTFDGETVTGRAVEPDGALLFTTQKPGNDNNKPATFRYSYRIGKNTFSRKKEVSYTGDKAWFIRNELSLQAN